MFEKLSEKMGPQAVRNVKIAAVVVGVVAGVAVVGAILYKTGMIATNPEMLEEVIETAAQAA